MRSGHAHRVRGRLRSLDDRAEGRERDNERDQWSTEHEMRRNITSEAERAPEFPPVRAEFLHVIRRPHRWFTRAERDQSKYK